MTTGKVVALTVQTFVGQVMSLLFSRLFRYVIAFLSSSKHLLISWVKSPSTVILEPKKIKSVTQSVQFSCFIVSDSSTSWTAALQASLTIINSWSLLRLMSIESVMPSNNLIFCFPLLLLPSILCIRWPKYWSFSFSISPSNEYSGLISFRMVWLDLLPKGLSRVFSNTTFQSINSSVLSFLYSPTLTSIHD